MDTILNYSISGATAGKLTFVFCNLNACSNSFNGKELDEESGMYYYSARYYAPPSFISRDPLFEKYFWMSPYAYCANNPVKYVDPTGMTTEDFDGDPPDRPFGRPNYVQSSNTSSSSPKNTNTTTNTTTNSSRKTPSSPTVSTTTTVSTERSIPKNFVATASARNSVTAGEAETLNVNTTATSTTSGTPASVTVESQVRTPVVGAGAKYGVSSDGSVTLGGSVFLGPLQLGISTTESSDIINSSANISVDLHMGKVSKGFSVGIKPIGMMGIMMMIVLPESLPALLPALAK